MENRVEAKFAQLKKSGRKAFVAFITAGDPHLKNTPKVVAALEAAGVDIVELGMPFSDPMADGPVIQKSSERALRAGADLRGVLRSVEVIRKNSEIPILLMGYFNPIFQFGIKRFFKDAKVAGVDAVLLVDLPPEEGEETRKLARSEGISLVYLLSPTSDRKRIALVRRKGSGFIYYVSMTGITGAALADRSALREQLRRVVKQSSLPVCVGFGIQTPAQAKQVAALADGVVVGSALVECFASGSFATGLSRARRLAASLAEAVHSTR